MKDNKWDEPTDEKGKKKKKETPDEWNLVQRQKYWREEVIPRNLKDAFKVKAMKLAEDATVNEALGDVFEDGNAVEVYRGPIDDDRNTDNAWVETVAVNYHDEDGKGLKGLEGYDQLKWVAFDSTKAADNWCPCHRWIIQRV